VPLYSMFYRSRACSAFALGHAGFTRAGGARVTNGGLPLVANTFIEELRAEMTRAMDIILRRVPLADGR